jgi:predicted DNA-binding protein YlxM (UPF0122 family)
MYWATFWVTLLKSYLVTMRPLLTNTQIEALFIFYVYFDFSLSEIKQDQLFALWLSEA